mmetsp:Transcript_26932/g.61953  ORF Transcript_26932/g.61953 Transcript_26932/m.61953 type:complete len:252 (-) Transcript_26932:2390-3145(-)
MGTLFVVPSLLRSHQTVLLSLLPLLLDSVHCTLVRFHALIHQLDSFSLSSATTLGSDNICLARLLIFLSTKRLADCFEFHGIVHFGRIGNGLGLLFRSSQLGLGEFVLASSSLRNFLNGLCRKRHHPFLHLSHKSWWKWQLGSVVLFLIVQEPFRQITWIVPSIPVVGCIHQCFLLAFAQHHCSESKSLSVVITVVIFVVAIVFARVLHGHGPLHILADNFKSFVFIWLVIKSFAHTSFDLFTGFEDLLLL